MTDKIIIEGGDHVGKTTAAEWLGAKTGFPVIHAGIKGDDYDHVHDRMMDLGTGPGIYDRFHLSAFVYGRLLHRHPQNLDDESFFVLVEWLKAEGVITVIMYASDHIELKRRMREQGKAEAFDMEVRMMANHHYEILATDGFRGRPVCELAWNISTQGFPSGAELRSWL